MMARTDRDDLISLLQDWSYAAARMTQGLEVSATGAVGGSPEAPPDDTGEALGLPREQPHDHVRLRPDPVRARRRRPLRHRRSAVRPCSSGCPHSSATTSIPTQSGGDLCIQACADDPQVAVHAIRNLSRIAFGRARIRWSQLGFGRTSRTTSAQADAAQPVRLQGRHGEHPRRRHARRSPSTCGSPASDSPAWMAGGSYLVARKIAMLIETWDRVRLVGAERDHRPEQGRGRAAVGRRRVHRARLRARRMPTAPRSCPTTSHVRLAHPETNGGVRILRRGYNFVDGNNDLGRLDAGLFFLSYQRAPEQFVTIQRSLSTDVMSEYIRHVGSGLWAVPPGATPGSYVGVGLFA